MRVILALLVTVFVLAGCPHGSPQSVVGGTWMMSADYTLLPGEHGPVHEQWPMVFHEDGTVDLILGGPWKGTYTHGTSESIVHVASAFTDGSIELMKLSTTLVLRNGSLSGDFQASMGEELQDLIEQTYGVRVSLGVGTLTGSRVKSLTSYATDVLRLFTLSSKSS